MSGAEYDNKTEYIEIKFQQGTSRAKMKSGIYLLKY